MKKKVQLSLSKHWSYNIYNDPKRLAFVLSRYDFAASSCCQNSSIIEFGCSEGIGLSILKENAISYLGVDFDNDAISIAKQNWSDSKCHFKCEDFLGKKYGNFDTAISLDVIEHIEVEFENLYFKTLCKNLNKDGRCIVGTPNKSSESYASEASKAGHVNVYTYDRLKKAILKHFECVLMFGINDEVVHTGFPEMCHYLIGIGCSKKLK